MSGILPVGLSSPMLPAFQVPTTVKVERNNVEQVQESPQLQQLVQAPPKLAAPAETSNVSSQFKGDSQQQSNNTPPQSAPKAAVAQQSASAAESPRNTMNVSALMDSIAAQRAAAKLMERASELERLAQTLRAESKNANSTNNDQAKSADTAIQEAQSAHAQTLNLS